MAINLQKPDIRELKPKITVFGVGGGGGNAVNNMISGGLQGVEFVVANTDAQALSSTRAERMIQLGHNATQGLGAGSQPEIGRAAAEECVDEIADHLQGTHMAFVTAGMGGGTGTGAAPVVARIARDLNILTVGVVTKPFHFEGGRRMKTADAGILELQKNVDTLIVIPNQNLFRIANDKTTFADAFGMADQVLYSGVACITDLMVKEGLINLDFADVRSVMREMGKAMMGTGEASGSGRAMQAAEAAIANPLLDETSMRGAQGLLISITGGRDLTLFEVDEAATRIREEVDSDANIILGATFDESLEGVIRVSVVATGIDRSLQERAESHEQKIEMPVRRPALAAAPVVAPRPAPQPAPAVEAARPAAPAPAAAPAPQAGKPGSAKPAPAGVTVAPLRPAEPEVGVPVDFDPDFSEILDGAEPHEMAADPFASPSAEASDGPQVQQPSRAPAAKPQAAAASDDRSPMSLIRRIAQGMGAREPQMTAPARPSGPERAETPQMVQSESRRQDPMMSRTVASAPQPLRPAVASPQQSVRNSDNTFAPRQQASLDQHGRQATVASLVDDGDPYEIPAFLRRQTS